MHSSPTSGLSPTVTVTLEDLVLAIDQMGLTASVSAAELYHQLHDQAPIPVPHPSTSAPQKAMPQSELIVMFKFVIHKSQFLSG